LSELLEGIPLSELDSDTQQNGLLRLERKWVADTLPEFELLDALSHAYGILCMLVIDAYKHFLPELLPRFVATDGSPIDADLVTRLCGQLPEMKAATESRITWLRIASGDVLETEETEIEFRNSPPTLAGDVHRLAQQMLSDAEQSGVVPDERLSAATSDRPTQLLSESLRLFAFARQLFLNDGCHKSFAFLYREGQPAKTIQLEVNERADKFLVMERVANDVAETAADSVICISEAWYAEVDDPAHVLPHVDWYVDRKESLLLMAENASR
jgi:hypothetical protein